MELLTDQTKALMEIARKAANDRMADLERFADDAACAKTRDKARAKWCAYEEVERALKNLALIGH